MIINLLFAMALVTFTSALMPSDQMNSKCTPFGLRLFLGANFQNSASDEMLSIWFNTPSECPRSFVNFQRGSSISKVQCKGWKVQIPSYHSYVHKCSITNLSRGEAFEYMAYGWTGNQSDPKIPFQKDNLKSHLLAGSESLKLVFLGDWSCLKDMKSRYDSLTKSFDYLLSQNPQIDGLLINGDIAYDLDSNKGQNYQQFLIMLSQVSPRWPLILNPGNHEHKTDEDEILMNASYEIYGNDQKKVPVLDLGLFSLVMIDPYNIIYNKEQLQPLLSNFKNQIIKSKQKFPHKPVIVSCHYPILCSRSECVDTEQLLRQFYQALIDLKVSLFLSGHFHIYERIYPYIGNGKVQKLHPPYYINDRTNYVVSIVDGIAGNDHGIQQKFSDPHDFTAAASFNVTGYSVLTSTNSKIVAEHFTSRDPEQAIDSMEIFFEYGHKNIRYVTE